MFYPCRVNLEPRRKRMSAAVRRRLVVFATAAAVCATVPGAALADRGGVPNEHAKACKSLPSQAKAKGPKKFQPKNNNGKKCGLHRVANGI
jgi:hypothetical protein